MRQHKTRTVPETFVLWDIFIYPVLTISLGPNTPCGNESPGKGAECFFFLNLKSKGMKEKKSSFQLRMNLQEYYFIIIHYFIKNIIPYKMPNPRCS